MNKRHPEFLIWFVIISVVHYLVSCVLGLTLLNGMLNESSHGNPIAVLVLALFLKALSFPLSWFLPAVYTDQLSIWATYVLQVFNSALWGAAISFIVSLVKKRRARLDAF